MGKLIIMPAINALSCIYILRVSREATLLEAECLLQRSLMQVILMCHGAV